MGNNWDRDRAGDHIDSKLNEVKAVKIVDYARDMALENIPVNKGYRVDGVHLYADILNLNAMLACTQVEGETCHRRTLRFLNLHYRAIARVLERCTIRRVDFHNQRLHGVIIKPYGKDAEADRVHRAIAAAQLIIDVLEETGDEDDQIPNAKLRVGIDTGEALAVNNGRSGGREPLFLGEPANMAAKYATGTATGIYLTAGARAVIGLPRVDDPRTTKLTEAEIEVSQETAKLDCDKDAIVAAWRKDLEANPIGTFGFSAHTPPFRDLDISSLTPKNSRRQDGLSVYADLDGFTRFVGKHMHDCPEDVVKALHVLRSEMARVLEADFGGRKIRFIGDCAHGLLCEGTAQTTDAEATISTGCLCSGALRSSFELALDKLTADGVNVEGLGLQIGFEFGPLTVTRLGLHGDRLRCSVSRGVRTSEAEQLRCGADETAIGPIAYEKGTDGVRELFGTKRKAAGLDYDTAVEVLADADDETAKKLRKKAYAPAAPAVARAAESSVRPYAKRG